MEDLKSILGGIAVAYRAYPAAQQQEMLNAIAAWATPPQTDQGPEAHWSYDDLGQPVLVSNNPDGLFGKPEGFAPKYPVLSLYARFPADPFDFSDRRKAVERLTALGGQVPARVTEAFAVHAAITNTTIEPPKIDVATLSAKDAPATIAAYVDVASRLTAAREAATGFTHAAVQRIVRDCRASGDDILSDRAVRAEFDDAARLFSESYPLVRGCVTIADAAAADETGEATVAWHKATKARKRLDKLISVIVEFIAPGNGPTPKSARGRTGHRTVLGLSAAPDGDHAKYLSAMNAHGIDEGRAPKNHPFGVYAAQIDAGLSLELPKSMADLDDRTNAYNPGLAQMNLFFPDRA